MALEREGGRDTQRVFFGVWDRTAVLFAAVLCVFYVKPLSLLWRIIQEGTFAITYTGKDVSMTIDLFPFFLASLVMWPIGLVGFLRQLRAIKRTGEATTLLWRSGFLYLCIASSLWLILIPSILANVII